jgi:hypothetical protein
VVVADENEKEVRVLDAVTAEPRAVIAVPPGHSNLRAFLSRDARALVLSSSCEQRVYYGGWRGWLGLLGGRRNWWITTGGVTSVYDPATSKVRDRFPGYLVHQTDGGNELITADSREALTPDGTVQAVYTVSRWDMSRRPTGRSGCLAALAALVLLADYRLRRRRAVAGRKV